MTTIAYTGTSDFQEFSKADFTKAGVEDGKAVRFPQGEPVEVDDAVADALLSSEGVFGDHMFFDLSDVEEGETDEETLANQQAAGKKAIGKSTRRAAASSDENTPQKSGKNATTEGTTEGGTSVAAGTKSTGKGTSTKGTSSTS